MAVNATMKADIIAGITQLIADLEVSVTFNGNAYTAARGVRGAERGYSVMGELEGYEDTYTILQSALDANSDTPEVGDEITTPDGIRRILRIH